MKQITRLQALRLSIVLMLAFTTSLGSFAQKISKAAPGAGKASLRILIIGNSFSQNPSTYIQQLAKESGHELTVGHAEIGGCPLQKHWDLAEVSRKDPSDPKGRPYNGKSLRMLLSEGKWDVVTLQQYSLLSGDVSTYMPYARNLYNLIKEFQPQAEVVLQQTWAYRSDSKQFGMIASNKYAADEKEMYEKSRAAYHAIADSLHVRIIPTGDAFWCMDSDKKWGYKKDEKFDFTNHVYPTLPDQINSLHAGYMWDKDKKLVFDSHHANQAGKYLGSMVWHVFLFGEPAKNVRFVPKDVSVQFAERLKKCVDQVVK